MKKIDYLMIIFLLFGLIGAYIVRGIIGFGAALIIEGLLGIMLSPLYFSMREHNN